MSAKAHQGVTVLDTNLTAQQLAERSAQLRAGYHARHGTTPPEAGRDVAPGTPPPPVVPASGDSAAARRAPVGGECCECAGPTPPRNGARGRQPEYCGPRCRDRAKNRRRAERDRLAG